MIIRGRQAKGEQGGNCILSEEQAKQILVSTDTVRKIGVKYGISPSAVHALRKGKTWSHLSRK
jgi:hypothetical protein